MLLSVLQLRMIWRSPIFSCKTWPMLIVVIWITNMLRIWGFSCSHWMLMATLIMESQSPRQFMPPLKVYRLTWVLLLKKKFGMLLSRLASRPLLKSRQWIMLSGCWNNMVIRQSLTSILMILLKPRLLLRHQLMVWDMKPLLAWVVKSLTAISSSMRMTPSIFTLVISWLRVSTLLILVMMAS